MARGADGSVVEPRKGDLLRISVKLFKLVKVAILAAEDMHDDRAVIQNDPAVVVSALKVDRIHAAQAELIFHLACQGLDLRAGVSVADHEIVGDDGLVVDAQDLDSVCLFGIQNVKDGVRQLLWGRLCQGRQLLLLKYWRLTFCCN